ncbi:hypothetical protein D3C84_413760 [compost metagenome]
MRIGTIYPENTCFFCWLIKRLFVQLLTSCWIRRSKDLRLTCQRIWISPSLPMRSVTVLCVSWLSYPVFGSLIAHRKTMLRALRKSEVRSRQMFTSPTCVRVIFGQISMTGRLKAASITALLSIRRSSLPSALVHMKICSKRGRSTS